MNIAKRYREQVLATVELIGKGGNPAVIFGAGRAGWYIMKVLEHYRVPIATFCDNDPEKQHFFYDYPVLPPDLIARDYPDAHLFVGVFMPDTAAVIEKQFQQRGFQHIHSEVAPFLFLFLVEVAGRQCDADVLARSIEILFENYREGCHHYGRTIGGHFVSPLVTSVITQKCSLRCRDCAQLIPYYPAPVHFPVETVIEDLSRYAKAFDVVPEISLHGGEPFLHPDLAEICRQAAAIPNIVFISFVTNGTLLPPEATLRQLAASGADVHQSGGYGALSRKRDQLTEAFRRHGIYSDILFCSETQMWTKAPPYKRHGRPSSVNDGFYRSCVSTNTCCQLMKGELHRCALSMHGMHQGVFPSCEDDFVGLHEGDDGLLVGRIRSFLDRDRALSVCDYCDPAGGTEVPPAVQLPPADAPAA